MCKSPLLKPLNPADYFTLAMDQEIRNEGMPGSLCGFGLELNRTPDIASMTARIEEFAKRFPLSLARLQQRGRHFYWCQRDAGENSQLFYHHPCPSDDNAEAFHRRVIETVMNQQQPRELIAPLEFHLLTGVRKNTFFIRWIHPFCDARGADLMLKYLCTDAAEQRLLFDTPKTAPLLNIQLNKFRWWQKIVLFIKAKRYIEQIDSLRSIISTQRQAAPQRLNYLTRRISETQTREIVRQNRKHFGLTGTSLYFIACLMRVLEQINPDSAGDAYCVPYAFNLRRRKAISPVLGNHVSPLFAQAPKQLVQDRERLFQHLRQQNKQAIRQQLDYAFLPLMWAGNWLSLEKYGKTLRQSYSSGSERASFWFSDIGQPDLSGQTFLGAEIDSLFHLCQITSPPALALLSCIYRDRLTFSYNFIEPLFDLNWINQLHELLLMELLGETQ